MNCKMAGENAKIFYMDFETRAFKYQNSINRGGKGDHVTLKEAPAEPRIRSKKDTKKWCKGVVGREHKAVWVYTEMTYKHRQNEVFVEPSLEFLRDRKGVAWGGEISAISFCSVCRKCIKYGDAYMLRLAGVSIMTALPAQE